MDTAHSSTPLQMEVKNSDIKNIFESMNYGSITEGTSLAEKWIAENSKANSRADIENIYNIDQWLMRSPIDKSLIMERFAQEIERNSKLLSQLELLIRSISINDTKTKTLPLLTEYLRYYASWPLKIKKKNPEWKPQGIALSIIDDKCFLAMLGSVLGPALAAGYNILLHCECKITIIVSFLINLGETVGIPKGVISQTTDNLDLLLNDPQISVISSFKNLHDSTFNEPKKNIIAVFNSPTSMIVFNNGDLNSACNSVIDGAWGYGGFLPWRLNTILVQEDIFQDFADKLKDRLCKVRIGFISDKITDVTVSVNDDVSRKLQETISIAENMGIEVFQKDRLLKSFQPTLLIGGKISANNVIVDDEDLPIVFVISFRTPNEAANIANNSRNGFGVSVWTENVGLANEVVQKLNFSNIWINSFGDFSSNISLSPYKDSGIGYFGGPEGIYQYLSFVKKEETKSIKVLTNAKRKLLRSFYGGSFTVSESGVIDGNFDQPTTKDLFNAVAAAKKGYEVWKKETFLNRSQMLRNVALQIEIEMLKLRFFFTIVIPYFSLKIFHYFSKSTGESINSWTSWIELTYEACAQYSNTGYVINEKSVTVKGFNDPIGVIIIHETFNLTENFLLIIACLILGNSVIILNCDQKVSQFYVEICEILIKVKFPNGVFNVILNCNEEIFKNVPLYKDVAYFDAAHYPSSIKLKHSMLNSWSKVLMHSTKTKNVWCNVGDSVL
ncbi:hypothetical protein FQA39_LY18449 [Lamprigera yunnana]|nr:hypothetical protein FQA39_LY18449 [Lamprigera yunnana]